MTNLKYWIIEANKHPVISISATEIYNQYSSYSQWKKFKGRWDFFKGVYADKEAMLPKPHVLHSPF